MFSKKFIIQFIKYFGVALIGYVADFGALIILTEVFNIHYLAAATAGFTIGLVITYFLSNKFVFGRSKIKSGLVEFGIFAAIGIVGLILLNIIMWVLTDGAGINYVVSKIIATIFVYIWNFLARRKLYKD
jgi:putative flippase GtrA